MASFVGADRGLKRLRVRTLAEVELGPAPTDSGAPTIARTESLHFALSKMLAEGTETLAVTDGDDVVGSVRLDSITGLIGPGGDGSSRPRSAEVSPS